MDLERNEVLGKVAGAECHFGYQINTSKKQTKYLSIFTDWSNPLWYMDIHLVTLYPAPQHLGFARFCTKSRFTQEVGGLHKGILISEAKVETGRGDLFG